MNKKDDEIDYWYDIEEAIPIESYGHFKNAGKQVNRLLWLKQHLPQEKKIIIAMLRLCLGFTATSYLGMLVRIGYLIEHDGVYNLTDNADKFINETLAYMHEYIKSQRETQEVKK